MPGIAVTAAIDAVFTTQPGSPDARMRGTNAWMPWITPHRSTSMTRCHSESGNSHELPWTTMPALLIAHVQLPEVPDRRVGGALDGFGVGHVDDERVDVGASGREPLGVFRETVSSRSVMSTRMPAATNASVAARPIPLAAPVTTAARPANVSSPAVGAPCSLVVMAGEVRRVRSRRRWRVVPCSDGVRHHQPVTFRAAASVRPRASRGTRCSPTVRPRLQRPRAQHRPIRLPRYRCRVRDPWSPRGLATRRRDGSPASSALASAA